MNYRQIITTISREIIIVLTNKKNRRDQPLAALEEEYYDEHFVAELEQNVRDEQSFRPRPRSQPETFTDEQQTSVEIISKDSVFFCKQKPEVAVCLHIRINTFCSIIVT